MTNDAWRPAQHGLPRNAVPFRIDEVLARVSDSIEKAALEKNLELVVHRSREVPPMLLGDPVRLGHVLRHLAGNAVKFTTHGEVAIVAEHAGHDARRNEVLVRLSVTDTGAGVDAGIAALLAPSRPGAAAGNPGAARGLLFVRELVHSMGSRLELASAPGVGTDFSFAARFGVAATGPTTPSYRGLRVLIVDDNDTARTSLQQLLESAGCRVQGASDGSEAVAMLSAAATDPFELAIIDRGMPRIDGIETMRRIRHGAQLRQLPLIALATRLNRDETAACASRLAIAVEACLLKPIEAAALYRAIDGIVAARQAAAAGGAAS